MMYVECPELTESERIDSASTLNLRAIKVDVSDIRNRLPEHKTIVQVSMASLLKRPIYQLTLSDRSEQIVFADTGERVSEFRSEDALKVANLYAENMGVYEPSLQPQTDQQAEYLGPVDMDQWTVYGGLNKHRPLYKVALNNERGTILYISSSTGEVVRDTHAWERRWNWLGSTIHWIYPMQLRKYSDTWVNVVIWLSIAGVVAVLSGTIIGVLRMRVKRRYKNGAVTPYSGMQKWHHLLGIAFSLFIMMFILSGLFSMNPFGMFDNKTSAGAQVNRYLGGQYDLSTFRESLALLRLDEFNVADVVINQGELKELSWQMINGLGVLVARFDRIGPIVVNLDMATLDRQIRQTIPLLLPKNNLAVLTKITEYDNHYYSTHNRYRPLPAYRAQFDDNESSWYYIDAATGELLNRSTRTDRVQRWLYKGLHSLDFRFLLDYRPLWDLVVIVLSIAGVLFSYTSLVIGWRRLGKTNLVRKSKAKQGYTRQASQHDFTG